MYDCAAIQLNLAHCLTRGCRANPRVDMRHKRLTAIFYRAVTSHAETHWVSLTTPLFFFKLPTLYFTAENAVGN